jgi:hypothetical protein
MKRQFAKLLNRVQVTDSVTVDGMALFGLRWEAAPGPTYQTLDEAMDAGLLEITEVSEGGSVPDIKLNNKGDLPVFIMAGEQLIGAKQNRVINTSMMMPGASESLAPVSCVERGRWDYSSPIFCKSNTSSFGKLRRMIARHVLGSYRESRTARTDQARVWSEVDRKLRSLRSASPSDAMEKAYEDRGQRLQVILEKARVPEDCMGVAFAIGGRIAGVDLFDKPQTLQRLLPKLVKAYALDAFEETEECETPAPDSVAALLRLAGDASFDSFDSSGLGQDVRIDGNELVGASLVVEETPIHLELFSEV